MPRIARPVFAGAQAPHYSAWSSAAARCGLKADMILTADPAWTAQVQGVGDWSAWLAEADQPEQLDVLATMSREDCRAVGEEFIRRLERRVGQLLRGRADGRRKPRIKGVRPLYPEVLGVSKYLVS